MSAKDRQPLGEDRSGNCLSVKKLKSNLQSGFRKVVAKMFGLQRQCLPCVHVCARGEGGWGGARLRFGIMHQHESLVSWRCKRGDGGAKGDGEKRMRKGRRGAGRGRRRNV